MIVAGVGCRKGTQAADIEAAIATAFARAGLAATQLRLIATSAAKGGEPGIAAAASAIGVPLVLIPPDDLAAAGARTVTTSERVIALVGVPSLAEAAALAAGGPAARLVAPRIAVGPATCALADTGDIAAPSPSPQSKSAVADFDHSIDGPKPAYTRFRLGEGRGGGSGGCGTGAPRGATPTPDPSPQGGGEQGGEAP